MVAANDEGLITKLAYNKLIVNGIAYTLQYLQKKEEVQGKKNTERTRKEGTRDNVIPAFRFYRSAQPRFPLEALLEAASALNAHNSDTEDDVAETTSADNGDCNLWVDEEEDEENEEADEENVQNKISDSEIEASGNSRRTNKAISNLKCKMYVM
ncbi:hypothetical protein FQA39_LY04487 [Lamprigera yunnana]|nr:hypothetical protein FQA39_LY04487 [Lamprigera yunnana]